MPDRDSVIEALGQAIPFMRVKGYGAVALIMLDALELLKEQVAIKPTKFQKENDFRSEIVDTYRCGNCQHELDHVEKWSYCPKCGRKVLWD